MKIRFNLPSGLDWFDGLAFIGLVFMAISFGMVYLPAGIGVFGLVLFLLGIFGRPGVSK